MDCMPNIKPLWHILGISIVLKIFSHLQIYWFPVIFEGGSQNLSQGMLLCEINTQHWAIYTYFIAPITMQLGYILLLLIFEVLYLSSVQSCVFTGSISIVTGNFPGKVVPRAQPRRKTSMEAFWSSNRLV